jgi:hypothetical protein
MVLWICKGICENTLATHFVGNGIVADRASKLSLAPS